MLRRKTTFRGWLGGCTESLVLEKKRPLCPLARLCSPASIIRFIMIFLFLFISASRFGCYHRLKKNNIAWIVLCTYSLAPPPACLLARFSCAALIFFFCFCSSSSVGPGGEISQFVPLSLIPPASFVLLSLVFTIFAYLPSFFICLIFFVLYDYIFLYYIDVYRH